MKASAAHRATIALAAATVALAGCQLLPSIGATPGPQGTVIGHVVAGPVCPVERIPPDPACAPRPVPGATLVVSDAKGHTTATVVSNPQGDFSLRLPLGDYTLTPQPVQGLLGTPAAMAFSVTLSSPTDITVEYDTGIR